MENEIRIIDGTYSTEQDGVIVTSTSYGAMLKELGAAEAAPEDLQVVLRQMLAEPSPNRPITDFIETLKLGIGNLYLLLDRLGGAIIAGVNTMVAVFIPNAVRRDYFNLWLDIEPVHDFYVGHIDAEKAMLELIKIVYLQRIEINNLEIKKELLNECQTISRPSSDSPDL